MVHIGVEDVSRRGFLKECSGGRVRPERAIDAGGGTCRRCARRDGQRRVERAASPNVGFRFHFADVPMMTVICIDRQARRSAKAALSTAAGHLFRAHLRQVPPPAFNRTLRTNAPAPSIPLGIHDGLRLRRQYAPCALRFFGDFQPSS